MLSYLDSKFDELKKETEENFNDQNKKVQNQLESVTNQCKKIQSALVNQTKQQGLIQNLVLDLKNYTAKQDAAQDRIEKTEIDYDCKICMDKQVSIALKSCGHIVCCDDCAPKLPRNCPLCRHYPMGRGDTQCPGSKGPQLEYHMLPDSKLHSLVVDSPLQNDRITVFSFFTS